MNNITTLFCALALLTQIFTVSVAQDTESTTKTKVEVVKTSPVDVGGQITATMQTLLPFHSPYSGTASLVSRYETEISHTYTLQLGTKLSRNLEFYLNPEMARGAGVGGTIGLAGYVNGDVIRNPDVGESPYLARYFARWTPVQIGEPIAVAHGMNQVPTQRANRRLQVTAGKLGANDIFDLNSYANSTRTQFMNWALINSAAYDYAADTRGYSQGVAIEWFDTYYAARLGSFKMPTVANGPKLSGDLVHSRGDQLELEVHPEAISGQRATLRTLLYRNYAGMGDYRTAIASGSSGGTVPEISSARQPGAVKYGFVINGEQPLAESGAQGLFFRYGWNDGHSEDFAYTEADRSFSLGAQWTGKHWRLENDRVGIAIVQNDLSAPHMDYLAAGGVGFIVGDGKLNYGPERILETYYAHKISKYFTLSADFQGILNPGYNKDRGPVNVFSMRLHGEY